MRSVAGFAQREARRVPPGSRSRLPRPEPAPAPSGSGAQASRRGLPDGRATRSTRPLAGASRLAGPAGSGRTQRRGRAGAGTNIGLRCDRGRVVAAERTPSAPACAAVPRAARGSRSPIRRQRPSQKTLPINRRRPEAASSPRHWKGVEPRRDDSLHRLGERELVVALLEVPIGHHPDELLRVERIAAGALQQHGLGLGGQDRPFEQGREQPGRLLVVERGERERSPRSASPRPTPAGAPAAPAVPCRRRGSGRRPPTRRGGRRSRAARRPPSGDPRRRARAGRYVGDRLEEPAPGGERLGPVVAAQLLLALERRRGARRCRATHSRVASAEVAGQALLQLLAALVRRVRLEDAGLRLDHLAQRPEGNALAVRQRAPLSPEDEIGLVARQPRRARRRGGSCRSPGTPTSVTSCGERSSRARGRAQRRATSSSRSRPMRGARGA